MERRAIRRAIFIAVGLAILAFVLPPFINVERYKGRVVATMSAVLGRPVTVDAIKLRLLPQPGFDLSDVAVGDDPTYSAESILHADGVTAYLSLSSLWRGQLEIARLDLKYPSLNLVERESDSSWNLESLLWKASRTQAAPTAARASGSRPRFPYIVASEGRINLKYGLEKSVFSAIEANFTLWSPAENQWRMKLDARPVRTDLPVTDTGTLKVEAIMQRAELLRDAPLNASVTWERVQLGNLTRLIYAEDRGWRGTVESSAQFSGTPGALKFTAAAKLRDFRRFDISSNEEANLSATCTGELNVGTRQFQNTDCRLPIEKGLISIKGLLHGLRNPRYDLAIKAQEIPANALLNLAKRAKRDLPPDLTANGTVSASFHAHRTLNAPPDWVGQLQVSRLLIHSAVLGKDLAVNKALATVNTTEPLKTKHRGRLSKIEPPVRALVLHNFDLPLGGNTPAIVDGRFDGEQIAFRMKGDASLERLQQLARTLGVGAPKIALSGQAAIDLVIGGKWANFSSPEVTGTAQLKNVRAEVPGFSVPVEIGTAQVEMDGNRFEMRNASAILGKIAMKGSASFPRHCDSDLPCQSAFDLSTEDFNPERWNAVLNSRLKKKPWFHLFGTGEAERNVIANLHATGRLTSRHVTLGTATGSAFETDFSLSSGLLELKNTRTDFLGGKVSGEWKIDFNGNEPKYESTGTAEQVQIEKLGTLAKASLGSGNLALKYKLEMSGWTADDLAKTAKSEAKFTWNGGFLKLSPHGKAPLRVTDGVGKATLGSQGWTISASKWNTPTGTYSLTGTASRDKAIAMEFTQEKGSVWKLTGTLLNPQSSTAALHSAQAKRR